MITFFLSLFNKLKTLLHKASSLRYYLFFCFVICCFLYLFFTLRYGDKSYLSGVIQILQDSTKNGIYLPLEAINDFNLGFQFSGTPIMKGIIIFHNHLMFLVISVVILVLTLIFGLYKYIVAFRLLPHDRKSGLKFSHAALVEILWTVFPTIILFIISVPSFSLLYAIDAAITPKLTLKTIAHQWYWSYEYGDFSVMRKAPLTEPIGWDCYVVPDSEILTATAKLSNLPKNTTPTIDLVSPLGKRQSTIPAYQRLLLTDKWVELPSRQHIRLIVTSSDVLHSWAIPAFGIKVDAVPGRLNQIYFYILRDGYFYGQCSEICGINHGFMPIALDVMPSYIFFKRILNNVSVELIETPKIPSIVLRNVSETSEEEFNKLMNNPYMPKSLRPIFLLNRAYVHKTWLEVFWPYQAYPAASWREYFWPRTELEVRFMMSSFHREFWDAFRTPYWYIRPSGLFEVARAFHITFPHTWPYVTTHFISQIWHNIIDRFYLSDATRKEVLAYADMAYDQGYITEEEYIKFKKNPYSTFLIGREKTYFMTYAKCNLLNDMFLYNDLEADRANPKAEWKFDRTAKTIPEAYFKSKAKNGHYTPSKVADEIARNKAKGKLPIPKAVPQNKDVLPIKTPKSKVVPGTPKSKVVPGTPKSKVVPGTPEPKGANKK